MKYCDKTTKLTTKHYLLTTMSALSMYLLLQATEAMEEDVVHNDNNAHGFSPAEVAEQERLYAQIQVQRVRAASPPMPVVQDNPYGLSQEELAKHAQRFDHFKQRAANPPPAAVIPQDVDQRILEAQRRLLAQYEAQRPRADVPVIDLYAGLDSDERIARQLHDELNPPLLSPKLAVRAPSPRFQVPKDKGEAHGEDESERFARQLQAEEDARVHAPARFNADDEALAKRMQQEIEAAEQERIRAGEAAARALQARLQAEEQALHSEADSALVAQIYQRDMDAEAAREEAARRALRDAENAASEQHIARLEAERQQALAAAAQQRAIPFVPAHHPVAIGADGFQNYDEAIFNPPEPVRPPLVLVADPHPPARVPVIGQLYNIACAELAKMGPMPVAQMRQRLAAHAFNYMGVMTQMTPGQAQYVIDKMMGEDVGEEPNE